MAFFTVLVRRNATLEMEVERWFTPADGCPPTSPRLDPAYMSLQPDFEDVVSAHIFKADVNAGF